MSPQPCSLPESFFLSTPCPWGLVGGPLSQGSVGQRGRRRWRVRGSERDTPASGPFPVSLPPVAAFGSFLVAPGCWWQDAPGSECPFMRAFRRCREQALPASPR